MTKIKTIKNKAVLKTEDTIIKIELETSDTYKGINLKVNKDSVISGDIMESLYCIADQALVNECLKANNVQLFMKGFGGVRYISCGIVGELTYEAYKKLKHAQEKAIAKGE